MAYALKVDYNASVVGDAYRMLSLLCVTTFKVQDIDDRSLNCQHLKAASA